jgi:hypothetical protein
MRWILLRGSYYNLINIERIKIEKNLVIFYYVHSLPTSFYNVTKEEIELLMKKINNEN